VGLLPLTEVEVGSIVRPLAPLAPRPVALGPIVRLPPLSKVEVAAQMRSPRGRLALNPGGEKGKTNEQSSENLHFLFFSIYYKPTTVHPFKSTQLFKFIFESIFDSLIKNK
jgi:hypothetical protein